MHDERQGPRRDEREGRAEREGGLLDLLRRVVAPRQPSVLVMERDGRLRRAGGRADDSRG